MPRLISVLALILIPVLAAGAVRAEPAGVIAKKSPHAVEETLDRLQDVLESKGLTIFARVDHAAGAGRAGMELRPTQLLIFGNPKLGTPLMQASRSVAIDLPQKALAYEDAEGQVWLAYNDPAYLAERHGLAGVDDVLSKIAGALDALTDKAVGAE